MCVVFAFVVFCGCIDDYASLLVFFCFLCVCVRCSVFVVRGSLFGVSCVLLVVRHLLLVSRCSLLVVVCSLFKVCCLLLFDGLFVFWFFVCSSYLLFVGRYSVFDVC